MLGLEQSVVHSISRPIINHGSHQIHLGSTDPFGSNVHWHKIPPARLQAMPRFHSRRDRIAASVPPQEQLLRSTSLGDQGNPIPLTSCRQAKASYEPSFH